jgi:hypothetical protein
LLRDGEIKAFDEAAVTEEAEKCAAELREIAGAAAADLAALRAPYAGWHARTFTRLSCGCGGPPGGGGASTLGPKPSPSHDV